MEMVSGWPFATLILIMVIGPWVCAILLFFGHQRRFDAVVKMYEANVELVNDYKGLAVDVHDVVILNTQVLQQLVSDVEKNQFCPLVRKEQR